MLKSIIYICLSAGALSLSGCIPVHPGAYISAEPLHHSNVVYTAPKTRTEVIPTFPNGYHRYDPTYLTPGEYSNYYWKFYNGYWYRHLRVKPSYQVYTPHRHRYYPRRYRPNRHRVVVVKPRIKIKVAPTHSKAYKAKKKSKKKGKKKWRKK